MALELAQIGGTWPVAVSVAAAATARSVAAGRRRTALNEALHELRRPLQALVLFRPGGPAAGLDSTLRMAVAAFERLDREINGEVLTASPRSTLQVRPLLEAAVERWRAAAGARGGRLSLREEPVEPAIRADRAELERAIDNLIVNAIEHGGPRIVLGLEVTGAALRLSVVDSGRLPDTRRRRGRATRALARISGRRRRGHGLRVVRRIAAAHGGELRLRRSPGGAEATLELPICADHG